MKTKAVFFDLDGTLLPMDQDVFVKSYMKRLAAHLAPHGYEPERLVKTIWGGTEAMVRNNGEKTNEGVFWDYFSGVFGERAREDEVIFEEFYRLGFPKVAESCGFNPRAAEAIAILREKGIRRVLATNPIFPAIATEQRIKWAGLERNDFELVTTYENSRHAKPNPAYYADILGTIGLSPEECLMVGNDVGEDMIASSLGMKVFLVTDDLINRSGEDITTYPNGSLGDLCEFLRGLNN